MEQKTIKNDRCFHLNTFYFYGLSINLNPKSVQNASIEQLLELKKSFENLSPFWFDWVQYKYNGLDEIDVYIIETFRKKEFKFNLDNSTMFYYRKNIIENIIEKFEGSYPEFQDWVIVKFQILLLNILTEENTNSTEFESLNIQFFDDKEINTLFLEDEIKVALLSFKCKTIKEILERFSDTGFKEKIIFQNILNFHKIIKELKRKSSLTI